MKKFRVTLTRHDVENKKILSHDSIEVDDLVEMWFQLGLVVMKIQAEMTAQNQEEYRKIVEGDIPF